MTGAIRHPGDDALQEWVDGTSPAPEASRIAGHVAGCAACGAEAERLRELLAGLRSLPRGMTPPETALAGARARAEAGEVLPLRPPRPRVPRSRAGLAAAAVALVVVGAALGLLLGPEREPAPVGPAPGPAMPGATTLSVTDDYDRAVSDLTAELEARRGQIDPATARIVAENLRIVDRALAEARAALATDPSDPVLRDLVVAGYEQKLDLLRRATRPAGEI